MICQKTLSKLFVQGTGPISLIFISNFEKWYISLSRIIMMSIFFKLSQEITDGVNKSAQAVQAAEAGIRQIGTLARQQTICMFKLYQLVRWNKTNAVVMLYMYCFWFLKHFCVTAMIQERANLPIISMQPVVVGAAKKTSRAVGRATKTFMNIISRGEFSSENEEDSGIDRVEIWFFAG